MSIQVASIDPGHTTNRHNSEVDLDLSRLSATDEAVASLTRSQRELRVSQLLEESFSIYRQGLFDHIVDEAKEHAGTIILFSGGNDSTVLAHVFRGMATHAAHANTGIGIEQTREYVRKVCADWGLPLLERSARNPQDSYEAMVMDQGFPGPGHHFKMYQRLKERALSQVRRELVTRPRQQRVIFLAGRRRQESDRRASVPEFERTGSIVWISPLVNWTKIDMNTYRLMQRDVPVNEVSDLIHMSGECLCGSFATKGELEEIGRWFPAVRGYIEDLEARVLATGRHPDWKCRWGWGADRGLIQKLEQVGIPQDEIARLFKRSASGPLCTTCDARGAA